jgi:glutathione S-transferase
MRKCYTPTWDWQQMQTVYFGLPNVTVPDMKIIGSLTSPYARKVRIVAIEKKFECEFVKEDVWSPDTQIAQQNPLGKIPALVLDDGVLFDSRVIVEYLDSRAPTIRLIPSGNRERSAVRTLEALADGLCDAAIAIMLEKKFHGVEAISQDWLNRQAAKVDGALAMMSQTLGKSLWMNDKAFSLADIACGVALGYLELRFPENTWKQAYPNLADFYVRMMERPSFQATKA